MKAYDVPGLSSKRDLNILSGWAKSVPENGVIVEIGSFFGRTAVALAEGAPKSAKIYCIDYFDNFVNDYCTNDIGFPRGGNFWEIEKTYSMMEEFLKFTKDYSNIEPLILDKPTIVYPYQHEHIDLLFLDCAHRNPDDMMNIEYFRKFLKPNAMICGHDYWFEFPDVIENVKFLEKLYNTTAILDPDSSVWGIRT